MSSTSRDLVRGLLTAVSVALTVDYFFGFHSRTTEPFQISDAVTYLSKNKGDEKLLILGPTSNFSVECRHAQALCSQVNQEPKLRPTVWLKRVSFLGEHFLVRAEVSGKEVISEAQQARLLQEAGKTKLYSLTFVLMVVFAAFMFPTLTRRDAR